MFCRKDVWVTFGHRLNVITGAVFLRSRQVSYRNVWTVTVFWFCGVILLCSVLVRAEQKYLVWFWHHTMWEWAHYTSNRIDRNNYGSWSE